MRSERILAAAKKGSRQGPHQAPLLGQQVFWRLGLPVMFLGLILKKPTRKGCGADWGR